MCNLYEKLKMQAAAGGIILFILGFILLVLSAVLSCIPTTAESVYKVVFPAALGTISLGIGLIAVGVTVESDKRYTELLGRMLRQMESLQYKLGDKIALSIGSPDRNKEDAQKRLDEDTKKVGYQRGDLFQNKDGTWSINWGGKYPL